MTVVIVGQHGMQKSTPYVESGNNPAPSIRNSKNHTKVLEFEICFINRHCKPTVVQTNGVHIVLTLDSAVDDLN